MVKWWRFQLRKARGQKVDMLSTRSQWLVLRWCEGGPTPYWAELLTHRYRDAHTVASTDYPDSLLFDIDTLCVKPLQRVKVPSWLGPIVTCASTATCATGIYSCARKLEEKACGYLSSPRAKRAGWPKARTLASLARLLLEKIYPPH